MTVWRKAADFDANRASPMTLHYCDRAKPFHRSAACSMQQSRKMDPIEAAAEVADVTGGADNAVESMQADARLHGCLDGLASHSGRAALRGAFLTATPTKIWPPA